MEKVKSHYVYCAEEDAIIKVKELKHKVNNDNGSLVYREPRPNVYLAKYSTGLEVITKEKFEEMETNFFVKIIG